MQILIKNVAIVPMSDQERQIDRGYILIQDQFIKALGSGDAPQGEYDKIIDGQDKVVLPGFVNTHTHAAMTLLRGYADDLPLMEWLETKIWPLEAKMSAEDIYWGTMLAIVEMLKSGTTCFNDMYDQMDKVAEAVQQTGIRAVLARGMIGVGPNSEQAIQNSRELVKKWHGAEDGRIQIMLGPHAPYTCPPEYLKRVADLAGELQVGIHIHLAETLGECEDIQKQYSKTPVALMEEIGIFAHRTVAAHCVHLTDEDIQILKKYHVGVAHNPESNMKLASGIAPVHAMLQAGIPVALGTDGASSNNDLDMLQEMRTAALLQKVSLMDSTVVPAYQALEMATKNGARALGMEHEVGQLTPGFRADLILINLQEANMVPAHDMVANLVYAAHAGDVETVIVNGRIVMEERKILTVDEALIIEKVRETVAKLSRSEG